MSRKRIPLIRPDKIMNDNNRAIAVMIGVLLVGLLIGFMLTKSDNLGGGSPNQFRATNVSATTTTTAAGKASVVLLESSARKYAVITNTGGTIAYLALNSATTSALLGGGLADREFVIPLAASGGSYVINDSNLYMGQVIASSSAAVAIRALTVY